MYSNFKQNERLIEVAVSSWWLYVSYAQAQINWLQEIYESIAVPMLLKWYVYFSD